MNPVLKLILCIALPLAVGAAGGFATATNVDTWYTTLEKPAFNPPNWLFGPVWTTLYLLMGIGLFRILSHRPSQLRRQCVVVFGIQLFLNFWWSFLFFAFHLVGWAFVEIVLIWISVLSMILVWRRLDPVASWMQVPLLLWVTFASVLNGAIFVLNK